MSGRESETLPFLLFRVRQHFCGLPLVHIVETMRPLPIEAITGAPPAVKGLAVIRGIPLPVIDVGGLIDGGSEPYMRFIIVRAGANQIALGVQSVIGVRYLSAETLRDTPLLFKKVSNSAIAAIGRLDAELLLVLNAAQLVPESTWLEANTAGEIT
jgi:purine-binding chemotaxis protein CheW